MSDRTKISLWDRHPRRFDIPLLIVISAALLVAGLKLPVLTVRKIWATNTFSILSGITSLRDEGQPFLASVVFFFSVIFPIAKLAVLAFVWLARVAETHRRALLRTLEAFGRWSMLDVFIVAVIIVSVKLGVLAEAKPERGIYYFGASVLLSMTATALLGSLARRSGR